MSAPESPEAGEPHAVAVRGVVLGPVALALSQATASASSWIEPADTGALAGLEVLADLIDTLGRAEVLDAEAMRKACATFLTGLGVMGLTPAGRGRLELEVEVDSGAGELVALVGGRAG